MTMGRCSRSIGALKRDYTALCSSPKRLPSAAPLDHVHKGQRAGLVKAVKSGDEQERLATWQEGAAAAPCWV